MDIKCCFKIQNFFKTFVIPYAFEKYSWVSTNAIIYFHSKNSIKPPLKLTWQKYVFLVKIEHRSLKKFDFNKNNENVLHALSLNFKYKLIEQTAITDIYWMKQNKSKSSMIKSYQIL